MSDQLQAYVSARVIEDGDCLRWKGYCYNGHPGGTIDRRKVLIRRELYVAAKGPIPKGKILRCTCETPLCVNVEHVVPTTYKAVAKECGAQGLMSGPVRSARIAAAKRVGPQARISQDDARVIRDSDELLSVLAARYQIAECTCSRIKRGEMRREYTGNPWAGLVA